MNPFSPASYGPALTEFLRDERLPDLGPGAPNLEVRPRLGALSIEAAFAGKTVRDRDMASLCLAGLWLRHDFLDECHTIAQAIETPTGSYWHAIMHRREPDASNSKYWWRRVGPHPVFESLGKDARTLAADEPQAAATFLKSESGWDPFMFVDWCESVREERSPGTMLARRIQQREWELLFDWCYQQALATG
jgi:hypothetical protein